MEYSNNESNGSNGSNESNGSNDLQNVVLRPIGYIYTTTFSKSNVY